MIFNKMIQSEVYNVCKENDPENYKFWNETYILPRDYKLVSKLIKEREGSGQVWVYKTAMSCLGVGISMITTFEQFKKYSEKEYAVIQN